MLYQQTLIYNEQNQIMKSASTKAVPLVTYSEAKGYSVTPQAIEFLRLLPEDGNYAVVTAVGKSKTGKSFLLNQLLGDQHMFPVSSHLANCTKGIMLATNFIEVDGRKILVLDAEGFGSMEGSDDRDCKLFVLCMLLSSVILYNSSGTIDEQTLNNLSLIIEVGKMFQKELGKGRTMPALFWVLRDFSLQLLDRSGFPITPVEYLESSLEEQKGSSQATNHKNRIRRIIKTVFVQRTCSTLVLPCDDTADTLSPQDVLDAGNLRPEFKEDIERCRKKLYGIINKKGNKQFLGESMTISSFVNALQTYIESFNSSLRDGSLPKIENMTYQLRQNQAKGLRLRFRQFLRTSRESIVNSLLTHFEGEPGATNKSQLFEPVQAFYRQISNSILQLTGHSESDLEQAKTQFYDEIEKECQEFLRIRDQYSDCRNEGEEEIEVSNLCEFFQRISEQHELDHEYSTEIHRIKQRALKMDPILFSNFMMKLEIAYLRRKVDLTRERHLRNERSNIELEYAKKEISRLEARNKELEVRNRELEGRSQVIDGRGQELRQSHSKENMKTYTTPIKGESFGEVGSNNRKMSTFGKEPGYIRTVNQSLMQRCESKQINPATTSNSSFYVPYVLIQKSDYLSTTIVRTLIKEDSRRNNYIEYVIEVSLLGQKWALNRKFKDFSELHSILVMMFQNERIPQCRSIVGPPTKLENRGTESSSGNRKEVVQQRRRELENYLLELVQVENIRNSRILQKFLKINKEYTVL